MQDVSAVYKAEFMQLISSLFGLMLYFIHFTYGLNKLHMYQCNIYVVIYLFDLTDIICPILQK